VEYSGHKDVEFIWFKEDAETAWDKLFTEDEAKQLAAYLMTFPGEITIKGVTQLADDAMPYGAIPVGGETDFHMLSKKPGYPLSFSVWGYFDLRSAEGPLGVLRPERDKGAPRITPADLDTDIPF
jgi:hypothetical protein